MLGLAGCVSTTTRPMVIDPARLELERYHQQAIALESQLFDQMRLQRVGFPVLNYSQPDSEGVGFLAHV